MHFKLCLSLLTQLTLEALKLLKYSPFDWPLFTISATPMQAGVQFTSSCPPFPDIAILRVAFKCHGLLSALSLTLICLVILLSQPLSHPISSQSRAVLLTAFFSCLLPSPSSSSCWWCGGASPGAFPQRCLPWPLCCASVPPFLLPSLSICIFLLRAAQESFIHDSKWSWQVFPSSEVFGCLQAEIRCEGSLWEGEMDNLPPAGHCQSQQDQPHSCSYGAALSRSVSCRVQFPCLHYLQWNSLFHRSHPWDAQP